MTATTTPPAPTDSSAFLAPPAPPAASTPPTQTNPPVPRRPRLLPGLPVLRRTAGETQFGTDPRHAIVVTGVPDPVARLLHDMDGRHTTDELMARAGPEHELALTDILNGLAGRGLLDDAAPGEPSAGPALPGRPARLAADRTAWALRAGAPQAATIRDRANALAVVYGSGRVAVAAATLLAAAGVGWVHPVPEGVVQPEDTGVGYLDEDIGRSRARAAESAVHRVAPEARTDRPDPRHQPGLVIIADSAVPDPVLAARLAAARLPHLLAHAGEGTGVVGPLVVPGRTSCLRCLNLHSTETDDCWPALAAQLAVRSQPADLASAQATAAFAVGQALRFLHGPSVGPADMPTWNATIQVDIFTGQSDRLPCPPHPCCSCGVARTPQPKPDTQTPLPT